MKESAGAVPDGDGPKNPRRAQSEPDTLNEAQRLHLRVSCEYMDKMLREIEGVLHSGEGASPFTRYQLDLSPAQGRVLEDYIRRFRAQILRALAWQHIEPPPPHVPATRAISTHIHFIDIAISELRPNQMRGSGTISETTAAELTGVLRELSSICDNMMSYVKRDLGESLQQRVEKLISEGKGSELLQRIESVVTARGLVEFRPRIDMLLWRLEDPTFEVAVFGRVSSGKSSFLNALLQIDLLPVGANPITAVPTRVQYGENVTASVQFGNSEPRKVSLERFHELISEVGNPGNREGVRYAMLQVPSPRLSEGIVLVDTPGLGSLALRGAQETLAYLPSCDLAIVLIDAGATLTPEDVGTLRLVLEAGISALVLLSKADLLREQDRIASIEYIRSQIERELRTTVPVSAVSSVTGSTWMIDEFYQKELEPKLRQSHELRRQSVHAKLARLQRDVVTSLESRLQRAESAVPMDASAASSLERILTDVAGRLGIADRRMEDRILALGFEAPALVEQVVEQSSVALSSGQGSAVPLANLSTRIQEIVQDEVAELIALVRETVRDSVTETRRVARDLKSSGLPEESEILSIIRDAPGFELPSMQGNIEIGFARHLGRRFIRNRLLKAVRESLQPRVHQELTAYSYFVNTWAKRVMREIQVALNSFADVYRASIQEMAHRKDLNEDRAKLVEDLVYLKSETETATGAPSH